MAYTLANLQDDIRNYTEVDDSVLSNTILESIIKNGARDASSDYLATNFFFFTVDTNTATSGSIKGGGYGCSVGPITISP